MPPDMKVIDTKGLQLRQSNLTPSTTQMRQRCKRIDSAAHSSRLQHTMHG